MGSSGDLAVEYAREGVIRGSLARVSQNGIFYFYAKRCLDIIIAGLLLIVLSPLMLLIAILVVVDSPGPAIFSQKRVGCKYRFSGGRLRADLCTFTFYKFRTMCKNADDRCHREFIAAYIHNDAGKMSSLQQGPVDQENQFKINGDKRVTRLGKFLRKSSLDELPQLWNVLRGDMSLVGPRPPIPYEVEMYEPWHRQRLYALPGITGLWQTTARNAVCFDEMVHLDIEYIKRQSFWLDLKILFLTPFAVISRKGK